MRTKFLVLSLAFGFSVFGLLAYLSTSVSALRDTAPVIEQGSYNGLSDSSLQNDSVYLSVSWRDSSNDAIDEIVDILYILDDPSGTYQLLGTTDQLSSGSTAYTREGLSWSQSGSNYAYFKACEHDSDNCSSVYGFEVPPAQTPPPPPAPVYTEMRYGQKLGALVMLVFGFLIAWIFARQYVAKGRR